MEEKHHQIKFSNNDILFKIQQKYFERKGQKPSVEQLLKLGNTVKLFVKRVNKINDTINKKKYSSFLSWKLKTFGYQNEIKRKVMNLAASNSLKNQSKEERGNPF